MATRARSRSLELQAAMALMMHNIAALAAEHIEQVKQWKETEKP
jgi:hypothetical protein